LHQRGWKFSTNKYTVVVAKRRQLRLRVVRVRHVFDSQFQATQHVGEALETIRNL